MEQNKIVSILNKAGIYFFSYSPEYREPLTLTSEQIDDLDAHTIAKYIYLLAQYINYVVQQRNLIKTREDFLKNKYEKLLNEKMMEQEAKTLKQKKIMASQHNELKSLEEEIEFVSGIRKQFDDVPDALMELLNALKRVQDVKCKSS